MRRVGLPPGGSTLITSAPSPARVSPQYSACSSASSMTRMPVRGPRPGFRGPVLDSCRWASTVTFSDLAVTRPATRVIHGSRPRVEPVQAQGEAVDGGPPRPRAGRLFQLDGDP